MDEVQDTLHCLFSSDIRVEGNKYVIEVPTDEVERGSLDLSERYRVALHQAHSGQNASQGSRSSQNQQRNPEPPVDKGECRTVEIEDVGAEGDGIAKVERGYVVIVPETEPGDEVEVEITSVKQQMAFAEIAG